MTIMKNNTEFFPAEFRKLFGEILEKESLQKMNDTFELHFQIQEGKVIIIPYAPDEILTGKLQELETEYVRLQDIIKHPENVKDFLMERFQGFLAKQEKKNTDMESNLEMLKKNFQTFSKVDCPKEWSDVWKKNLQEMESNISSLEKRLETGISSIAVLQDTIKKIPSMKREEILSYLKEEENSLADKITYFSARVKEDAFLIEKFNKMLEKMQPTVQQIMDLLTERMTELQKTEEEPEEGREDL